MADPQPSSNDPFVELMRFNYGGDENRFKAVDNARSAVEVRESKPGVDQRKVREDIGYLFDEELESAEADILQAAELEQWSGETGPGALYQRLKRDHWLTDNHAQSGTQAEKNEYARERNSLGYQMTTMSAFHRELHKEWDPRDKSPEEIIERIEETLSEQIATARKLVVDEVKNARFRILLQLGKVYRDHYGVPHDVADSEITLLPANSPIRTQYANWLENRNLMLTEEEIQTADEALMLLNDLYERLINRWDDETPLKMHFAREFRGMAGHFEESASYADDDDDNDGDYDESDAAAAMKNYALRNVLEDARKAYCEFFGITVLPNVED